MANILAINRQEIKQIFKDHSHFYYLLATIVILGIPILLELISDWYHDGNYSHGFLIIPIAVNLIYRQREKLVFPAVKAQFGLLVLFAGLFGVILATAASEFFTTRVSFLLIINGLSLYYVGYANFRRIWFGFFLLLFMIPIPAIIYYAATMPMQLLSTDITNTLLNMIGINSLRSGNLIYLPNYTLEVTEACSGLRSLITLMALGAIYSYLILDGRIKPVILFILTIPIAIAGNIVRLFVTAIGAYAISIEIAEGFLHDLSGMIVFISALILIIICGFILRKIKPGSNNPGPD